MDRNAGKDPQDLIAKVALRKESVDRNLLRGCRDSVFEVALRKESVDRNGCLLDWDAIGYTSLSARRAWIEIPDARPRICGTFVALRKESVDRNPKCSTTAC